MRKLICLLLASAALLGAGGARADIRPPVHVRILGEPRAAEPGVPFRGQLQVRADMPVTIADLMFTGDGWSELSLGAGPEIAVDKSSDRVVDFEVVASDPTQPLLLSFVVDGFAVTRTFDLSPAGVAFARGPNAVVKVREDAPPHPLTEQTGISPEPAPGKDGPAPQDPAKGRNIRVHGRFIYQRSDGTTIGADGITVRVYDDDTPFWPEIATTITNGQGDYDVTFWWGGDIFDPEPDLRVKFEATNSRIQTGSAIWLSGPYVWETGTTWDFTGTELDYGWLQPADVNQHPALHIQTNLVRTWRWWYWQGYDTPFVRANWPDGASGAYYNGAIYFSSGSQWAESTATHEYGHHWVQIYASSPAPDYCNGICDGADGCGHCLWCRETATVAFTEGFPDWMGDIIPRTFAADYGNAALSAYNMESLSTCGGSYDDPERTEGFLAAVVRDIGDATNDNHAAYPETDELALGWEPIITTVDLDHPTTAEGFLAVFKMRYQGYREGLWATAKNCNYELDISSPPAVTGLYSTSHSTSGDSPDPTIDFAWTRANDDCSGVEGYGITIANGIGLPTEVMDIGDVTSYTTAALSPGTWYFSIRTLDRSGKWSGTYNWVGPYVIRAPVPANLAFYHFGGWDNVLVPRSTNDASFGSVPGPVTLPGNTAGTYWNIGLWNAGESYTGSGFYCRAYVDGDYHWWVWSGELGPWWGQHGVNLGPLDIRGGRHTLEGRLDATELVPETNENDNRWARQWTWTPLGLSPNTPVARGAPPSRTAGWDAVTDGSPLYYNSDGLRMGASAWWDAVVLRPTDPAADYDLYLHEASTGATNGFAAVQAVSVRGPGVIDAVIVNRNVVPWVADDVGVLNYNDHWSAYEVVHCTNQGLTFGESAIRALGNNEMLRIFEVYVDPSRLGPVSVTVDIDPANGPVTANWLDNTFTRGSVYDYYASAITDASGRARLDMNLTGAGYHALVVWRDPGWNKSSGPMNMSIKIDTTPPDFVPLSAAGWHAPIVPRPALDGTGGSVPTPATLPGNVASTYMNVAARNNSPSPSPAGLPGHIYLDGAYAAWVAWGWFPAYADGLFNWDAQWNVRGGRHMLAWKLDADGAIEEMHEDNNIYGEQWVWTPLDLALDTPVFRWSPPDPYGDWTNLSTPEAFYPNCDGLRLPNAGDYWRAVAVMPAASSDVDLRLHNPSTGAKDGFAETLAGSYWWGSDSDYVLVNFNMAPGGWQPYDVGAVNFSGSGGFVAEATSSSGWLSYPSGMHGPYSLAGNRILNLVEAFLPAGQLAIHLMNETGEVDYGISLHAADIAYHGKSDALAMSSHGFGQGQDELLVVDLPVGGWYCVAVWKTSIAELPKAGTYQLRFSPNWISGVDDPLPAPVATALVDIAPNPFNPQTEITFDVAREGRVRLEIYDLQGRRMRTLADRTLGAGRHAETWNGLGDDGSPAASGLYMARLTAEGRTQMMKMTLLK